MDFPLAFSSSMRRLLSSAEYESFVKALQDPPVVSVRINPEKKTLPTDGLTPVPWSSCGYYLPARPQFTLDPLFHAGTYYVQEASSMFLEQALLQTGKPQTVLDLCAAPGGKSTLLRALLPDESLLVCNEPVGQRAQILAENMIKWGHEGCVVTSDYPESYGRLGAMFDLIVVDAPCSGEGMFRKDNPALELWSEDNVKMCAARQRDILRDVWPALKEDGYMIYSTCTYNLEENEKNVRYICDELGAEVVEIPVPEEWRIVGNLMRGERFPVYHFFPHRTRGEGLFMALLHKTASAPPMHKKNKMRYNRLPDAWKSRISGQCLQAFEKEGVCYAVREGDAPYVGCLQDFVKVLTCGIPVYEVKGKKDAPHHGLAMSRCLLKDAFPTVELSLEQALDYLRTMAIQVEAPRGYILLTYRSVPLGFANNLGAHANNMYPKTWRIRHS